MGGLVARAMIAEHPGLWRRVRALGGRLVMLGTPNGGSWEIVRLLTGRASTLKKLALLDLRHRKSGLLQLIREFPGILELLPEDEQGFFGQSVWERLNAQDETDGHQWQTPGQTRGDGSGNRLEQAGGVRARLRGRALGPDGTTTALPQRPPVSRGADAVLPLREIEPAFYPDEASLLTSALSMETRLRPAFAGPRVEVSVVHGNLAFAHHVVAVGHYTGSTIIAAEAYLDRILGGRLRAGLELDIYPGPLGTHAYFAHPHPQGMPRGALVVGLGSVGELTPSDLTQSVARALLGFVRSVVERTPPAARTDPDAAGGQSREIRLSSLLIGTGANGFSAAESVRALLRGVLRANASLADSQRSKGIRIAELELIEIRED